MLYALTNHTRHNEVTAIRAAGISLVRMCMPYFVAGLFFSVLLFAFNEFFAPQAGDKADEILLPRVDPKSAQSERHLVKPLNFINYGIGGKGRAWSAAVYNTETFEMTKPLVAWAPTNGQIMLLSANTAVWTNETWIFSGDVVENLGTVNVGTERILKTNESRGAGFQGNAGRNSK